MPLSDLTRDAVLAAIELSNSLGRDAFLKLGNFKRARGYFLVYGGRTYDSKAVAGAAHGYLPGKKALTSGDFFGGYATVKKKLEELGFEVHSPNETPGAGTNPGDILTNDDIVVRFGVGNMGGMRRNRQRKHLVLVSDPTKSLYDDRWEGDVLHYTGMGKLGDQELDTQNRTLTHSSETGETVHLFEAHQEGRYTYVGQVELVASPYQERQLDAEGKLRNVWMFPLGLKVHARKPLPAAAEIKLINEIRESRARKLPLAELRKRAEAATPKPGRRAATIEQISRDPNVAAYVKRRAAGRCNRCRKLAPFNTKKREPYLECHHIKWLAQGGHDVIGNAVALCPNCHRRMHVLADKDDIRILLKAIELRDKTESLAESKPLSVDPVSNSPT